MDRFTLTDLQQLIQERPTPGVSIYMPTFRAGREVRQNPIRLKNLLNQAVQQLSEAGYPEGSVQRFLERARQLEANDDFWQQQGDGLAMFLSDERFNYYRAPLAFDELVVIASRFHVKPLTRLLQEDGQFYVLAVSQNLVRLFRGTRFSVEELEPAGLPHDLRSALNIDEYRSTLQAHAGSVGGVGQRLMFHGHGASDLDVKKKDEILQFFHLLDSALAKHLGNNGAPLVFAGVEYLFPIYQETNRYRGLVGAAVAGNPDHLSADDLHKRAWEVVQPLFAQSQQESLERFSLAKSRSLATTALPKIVAAARQGQIDTLFVAQDVREWCEVDDETGEFQPAQTNNAKSEDLLNYVTAHTLLTSGRVFTLPRDRMPEKAAAAAIMRY